MSFASPVKNYHTETYNAISPSLPSLSSKGKNVLITGAGSGIGREIALSFARSSADNIAILGRRVEPLEETKQLIAKSYPAVKVYTYSADVTDLSALQTAFSSFASAVNGPIHTLVANAGYHPGVGKVVDFSTDSLAFSLTANVVGTANTLQAFHPHIPTHKDATGYKAKVIHVSSGVTHISFPEASAYSVAKTAGAKVMDFYALETPDVFVLNYHPGIVTTDMSTKGGRLTADTDSKQAPYCRTEDNANIYASQSNSLPISRSGLHPQSRHSWVAADSSGRIGM